MEHKIIPFELTKIDGDGRTFEGYAATFGNLDLGGDIIHPGAFSKTINERGGKIKLLWQHDPGEPIGRPLELREDGKGLFIRATVSDTARGRDALALLRDGAIDSMSIGYDAVKGGTDYSRAENNNSVRNLRELKLWEVSLVTFPMNEQAQVTGFKSVIGSTALPLASREMAWDGAGADQRVREWAGATEAPNAKYRQAFFWYDSENPENFTSYKLGFADVVDGELKAVPRGIFACAGSHGVDPADIPDGDKAAIKGKINRYYTRMSKEFEDDSIVSPFAKSDNPETENKQMDKLLGNVLSGEMYKATTWLLGHWLTCGKISQEELAIISAAINTSLVGLSAAMPEELFNRNLMMGNGDYYEMSAGINPETKAGRMLSQRNMDRLMSIMEELRSILSDAGGMGNGEDEPPEQDAKTAPEKQAALNNQAGKQAGPETPTLTLDLDKIELELLALEV